MADTFKKVDELIVQFSEEAEKEKLKEKEKELSEEKEKKEQEEKEMSEKDEEEKAKDKDFSERFSRHFSENTKSMEDRLVAAESTCSKVLTMMEDFVQSKK